MAIKRLKRFNSSYPGISEQAVMKEVAIIDFLGKKSTAKYLLNLVGAWELVTPSGRKTIAIVTNLAAGGDLFESIAAMGHGYNEKNAARLFKEACQGVKAVHDCGLLHRDLKPENLLLSSKKEDAHVIVADFGLAEFVGMPMRRVVGTLSYQSPEIVHAPPQFAPAVDVWALGVILYIMLSGSPPFWADHTQPKAVYEAALKANIQRGKFKFYEQLFKGVSEEVKDLISKMLATDPAKRITMDEVLAHPWIAKHTEASDAPLAEASKGIQRINARRKFKAAAFACLIGAHSNRVKELASLVRATGKAFTQEEVKAIRDRLMAQGAGGRVEKTQFAAVMAECGSEFTGARSEAIFALFDEDGDGVVDSREFVVGLAMLRERGEAAIKVCFELLDADDSGSLDKDELGVLIRAAHEAAGEHDASHHLMAGVRVHADAPGEAAGGAASAASGGRPGALSLEPSTPSATTGAAAMKGSDEAPGLSEADKLDVARLSTYEHLAISFETMDVDHDGRISFEEFKDGIKREPLLLDLFLNKKLDGLATPKASAGKGSAPMTDEPASSGAGGSS